MNIWGKIHLNLQKKNISTDTRSVQQTFNLITSFIQDSAINTLQKISKARICKNEHPALKHVNYITVPPLRKGETLLQIHSDI